MSSALDPQLLTLLVCPEDKGPLWFVADRDALYNERLRRIYEVRGNIPVMLIDDSRSVDDAEHEALMGLINGGGAVQTGPTGGN